MSFVSGFIPAASASDPPVPYMFTLNDYDLVGNPTDPNDLNTIRFLPFGKKPAPGTDIAVNYYPRTTDPAVINDLNVGSVIRTLMEAVCKEQALSYAKLNLAYDSAFLDSATGSSLVRWRFARRSMLGISAIVGAPDAGNVAVTRAPSSACVLRGDRTRRADRR